MGKKVLIIGGVAGGASAAARLRRLDESAEIIMFERDAYISFANCGLPYYIGETIKDRDKLLVQTPENRPLPTNFSGKYQRVGGSSREPALERIWQNPSTSASL